MCGQILLAWLKLLALDGDLAKAEPKTLRYRVLHAAGRLVRGGRKRRLKIQATWPWADATRRVAADRRAPASPLTRQNRPCDPGRRTPGACGTRPRRRGLYIRRKIGPQTGPADLSASHQRMKDRLGRLRRASAAAGDAGQMPSLPGPGVALVRRWCAHHVPADARGPGPSGMRYRARHLTIARCRPRWRPATGGRRDAIPVARLPTPRPPGRGRGTGGRHLRFHRHGQVGCRPGTGGLRGTGRGTGRDRAGMARPGWGQSGIVSCLGVPRPWTGCSQTHQSRCAVHRGRARNLATKGH